MFKKSIKEQNLYNLLSISKMLKTTEHFVFYGTLLGLTRKNDIIEGDDDVDFLVDYKNKNKVLEIIKKNKKFKLNHKNSSKYFTQFMNNKNGLDTFIDFYFYENHTNKKYIIERHNFLSNIFDANFAIHIPKKYIFPIKKNKKFKLICVPNKSEKICEYLYGKSWRVPLKKNTGYRMEIVNNKPMLIKRSYIGFLTREFKKRINNFFN
tara:strand:- start:187 stop:810 length:624 start_codon:yes stop_codon:yes gene_type:complete